MQPTNVLGLPPDIEQLLGRAHLLVLHFPIALLLAALLLELLSRLRRRTAPSPSSVSCCVLGTLGALAAALTGWLYAEYDDPGRSVAEILFWHRWVGVGTAAMATLCMGLALAARGGARPRAATWYRATLLLVAGAVVFVGHQGGEMVHGEGFLTEPLGGPPAQAAASPSTPRPGAPDETPLEPAGGPVADEEVVPPPESRATGEPAVDFVADVMPIFEDRCIECHGPTKRKGRLRLDTPDDVFKGAPGERLVQPGNPDASELLRLVELPDDDLDRMPGKGPPLTDEQQATLRAWIVAGAPWPGRPGVETPAGGAETTPSPDTGTDSSDDQAHADPDPVGRAQEPLIADADEATRAGEQAALARLVARGALAAPVAAGQRAVEVDFGLLGQDVVDDDLALLAGLEPALVWLGLQGASVTDAGLAALSDFQALRRLNLSRTAVGDEGLAALSGLVELQSLNLYGTSVSDAGLDALAGLTRLRNLYLWDTDVTPEGVARLTTALPEVSVDVGLAAETLAGDG